MSSAVRSLDLGRLLLRVVLGVLILVHGLSKLSHGIEPIFGMLSAAGLPKAMGYGVYIGEVVAPVLLIVGLWTRAAAGIVAFNMAMAFFLAHMKQLVSLNQTGGWALELQGMYLGVALAIMFIGAGRLSIGGEGGRLN